MFPFTLRVTVRHTTFLRTNCAQTDRQTDWQKEAFSFVSARRKGDPIGSHSLSQSVSRSFVDVFLECCFFFFFFSFFCFPGLRLNRLSICFSLSLSRLNLILWLSFFSDNTKSLCLYSTFLFSLRKSKKKRWESSDTINKGGHEETANEKWLSKIIAINNFVPWKHFSLRFLYVTLCYSPSLFCMNAPATRAEKQTRVVSDNQSFVA